MNGSIIRVALGLLLLVVAATTAHAAGRAKYRAYVPSETDLTVVDLDTFTVYAKLPLQARGVAVSPDGSRVYVMNVEGFEANFNCYVTVLDGRNLAVIAVVKDQSLGNDCYQIAISRDGSRLYLTDHMHTGVSTLNTATLTRGPYIATKSHPNGIAIHPRSNRAYVTSAFVDASAVSVLNLDSNTEAVALDIPGMPYGVGTNESGSKAYVVTRISNQLAVIDTKTNTVRKVLDIGYLPHSVTSSSFTGMVYITNEGWNSVSEVDPRTDTVLRTFTIPVGRSANGLEADPSGPYLYVTVFDNAPISHSLLKVDIRTGQVVGTIEVGVRPRVLGDFIGVIPRSR